MNTFKHVRESSGKKSFDYISRFQYHNSWVNGVHSKLFDQKETILPARDPNKWVYLLRKVYFLYHSDPNIHQAAYENNIYTDYIHIKVHYNLIYPGNKQKDVVYSL